VQYLIATTVQNIPAVKRGADLLELVEGEVLARLGGLRVHAAVLWVQDDCVTVLAFWRALHGRNWKLFERQLSCQAAIAARVMHADQ